MGKDNIYEPKFRRRREQKTDYAKRLALIKSKKPRMVVRKTNKRIICQLVEYKREGDFIKLQADSKELDKYGWKPGKNTPSSYLTGLLFGKKAGSIEAIADIGFRFASKGAAVFAAIKGAKDAGVKINIGEDCLPSEDRIKGKHLMKSGGIEKMFDEVKTKILDEKVVK